MSVKASFADFFLLPPHLASSNSSFHPFSSHCSIYTKNSYIFFAFSITYILLLNPPILVLYLGYQQWRKQRSISTAVTSHSDHFTYHFIAMHLNEFLGLTFFFCGGYINLPSMMLVGLCIGCATSLGQAQIHLLACVERYLAVVHPVTYRGLRQARGVRIRNISVGCVWLLCFGWMVVMFLTSYEFSFIFYICMMAFFLTVISFCSISVLCALKRRGPGEVGGNRVRVDQLKQRAFNTIMTVMGVLLFRFWGNVIVNVMNSSVMLSDMCMVFVSELWFSMPSSLVLPLLFLHRAGKLQCCKQNTESG